MGKVLTISVALLMSCSDENESPAPEILSDTQAQEIVNMAVAPTIAEAPASENVLENTENLQFPEKKAKSSNAKANAYGVTDYVDFNDELALTIIPDQAKFTFAASPFYIQKVGNAWVHVKENNGAGYNPAFVSDYGHYHLSYQNFTPCFTSDGEYGKPSGSACLSINPVKEARKVDTHDGSQWIKIYAYDYDSPKRTFDLLGIKVTKGPIQLWFKKKNGVWLRWSSLGIGTWNLSAYSTEITQVLISASGNYSIGFDNVKVNMPYY